MTDILCGYKLVRELGTRALPAYAAVAPKARRPEDALCVVEKLARDASIDAEAAAVFMRDAKRLSQVRHPNLVHVREVVVGTSIVLLVTNWVDGEVYSDVTRLAGQHGVPIPLAGSLRVVVDLLEGLSALHEVRDAKREPLNIVHAEVGPRNVVVGVDGRSVLVHPLRPPGKAGKGHASDIVGYLAPEVLLADKTADQRADVYGVGVILWEALAGRRMHAEGEDTGAIVMRLLGGHVEAPSAPIDAPWAAALVDVAKKAISPDPTNRYAHATEMLAAVRRAVVARLAPKLTVSALVEAVAGERIRARNAELGYVRPAPAQGTSPVPSNATPAPRTVRPTPPPFRPRADDSGATKSVRADDSGATRPARADDSGATKPAVDAQTAKPPIPDVDGTKPPPPLAANGENPSERMSIPVSISVVPSAAPGALTNDDRTPLRTVDPVTGEERPVFRSDPPMPAAPLSQRRSEPPLSADVIEVVEMEIPVDRPSRPKPPPHAPPPRSSSAVPRPPPLPTLEPAMGALTQSGTDMGSVARVAPATARAASKPRWPLMAACAALVAVGAWFLLRPSAPPPVDASTSAVATPVPLPAPNPSASSPAAPASAVPAPSAAVPSTSLPANAPGPFDPSSQGDKQPAASPHAASAPAEAPAARPAAAPAAAPSPAPASSTRSKKRVYDPMGI